MRHRALLVEIEEPQYGGKSGELIGHVVTVNGDGTRVRNIGNDWGDDHFAGKHVLLDSDLENFMVHSYIDTEVGGSGVWGWGFYAKPHRVDLRTAERLVKTLRHVSKFLAREERTHGYQPTAAGYFAAVARSIGAHLIVTLHEKGGGAGGGDWGYDKHSYQARELGAGIDRINRMATDYLARVQGVPAVS